MNDAATEPSEPTLAAGNSSWRTLVAWSIVALALAAFIALIVVGIYRHQKSADLAGLIASGKRPAAPQLPTAGLTGKPVAGIPDFAHELHPLPGQHVAHGVVVVDFWASWCGPCRVEAPSMVDLSHRYKHENVRFIGVDAQDAASDAQSFVREFKIDYPVVHASTAQKNDWGVTGFPEVFVIGSDGHISAHSAGPVAQQAIADAIDNELSREAHAA